MRATTVEPVETWSDETSPGRRVGARATRNLRLMRAGAVLAIGYAVALLIVASLSADLGRRFFRQTVCYPVFLAGAFSLDVGVRTPFLLLPWIYSMALAAPMTCRFMLRFPAGRRWFSNTERLLMYGPPLVLATLLSII